MSSQQCTYTTQGNMVCGGGASATRDAYIQTQFRGGCGGTVEQYKNGGMGLGMNQLDSAFKSVVPVAAGGGVVMFAVVGGQGGNKNGSLEISNDITGTYGLPWAPY